MARVTASKAVAVSPSIVPSHRSAIRKLEQEAATNHGVISRTSALKAGLSDSSIGRLRESGRWVRVFQRAYAVAGAPRTWKTELAAVVASLESGFAFSHRTAGALLGLDGVPENHIEIVTRGGPSLPGVGIHRVVEMPLAMRVEGFPVTSPHRTLLDLFAVLSAERAGLALDDALRKRVTSIDRLWDLYINTCARGRNGCRSFRNALLRRDDRDGKLQSRMETKLRRAIRSLPGVEPVPQFEVQTDSGRYFIDFAYPDIRLGIEAQSIRWHLGTAKFVYDMRRDRALKKQGWTMAYFGWDDLLNPAAVRNEITELRASRDRVLLRPAPGFRE